MTAIRAGRLVDPDSGTVLIDQIVLIRNTKIEKVGKGVEIPANARIIDLSNMIILPGLIDCHTHIDVGAQDSQDLDIFRKTAAQLMLESVPNARALLEAGFTTVRDVAMQAIQAATSNAADLLGHSSEFGSLKPGKHADIIAVAGDPLANIRLLEDVKFVMKDGKIYKQ